VDFVAGFRFVPFVPFVPFVAVCGVCGDGHKIRHKSTFGEFRPQNLPHLASLAIVILKMTICVQNKFDSLLATNYLDFQ
jgi:hypothetical protein